MFAVLRRARPRAKMNLKSNGNLTHIFANLALLTHIFANLADLVVYLSPADKYHRLTHRPSQGQKGLDERAIMTSPWSSHPW